MKKKYHVKKGDKVIVNSGDWKNEEATVSVILPKKDRVVLELANLTAEKRSRLGRKTVKKSNANPQGGMTERSVSVHVSNVTPVAKEAKPVATETKAE
ncbi:MAG: 50S ribosomal protein L24 [Victivallaceae bacterium]|nr:50S ribosomal protein L24 [Victivallaceae bacterium]MDD4180310.1 50S ribosomal protein L24 [Victivallaceae bacterium]